MRKRVAGQALIISAFLTLTAIARAAVDNSTVPATGYYQVHGRFLYDPCGERIEVRGLENFFFKSDIFPSSMISEIARTGANAFRLLPLMTTTSPPDVPAMLTLAQVEALIQSTINNKMIVDVAIDGGGVAMLLRPDIKAMLMKYEKYFLLHAKGESQEATENEWVNNAKSDISQMRTAGYKAPLYVLSTTYGRDLRPILNRGAEILAADPLHNIIFGWQAYWGASNWYQTQYGMTLSQAMARIRDSGLPIQVGLISIADPPNDRVDFSQVMADAQAYGIGWLWWDWRLSPTNLTTDGFYGHWATDGAAVVLNDANSLSKTSVKTAFLQNGVCSAGGDGTPPARPRGVRFR